MSNNPSSPEISPAQTFTDASESVADYALEDQRPTYAPVQSEPPRVRTGFVVAYMFAYFGLNLVMLMPALFSLAYKVQLVDPHDKDNSLGLVIGLGSILGLVFGPTPIEFEAIMNTPAALAA